jgi:hypothetical protein
MENPNEETNIIETTEDSKYSNNGYEEIILGPFL